MSRIAAFQPEFLPPLVKFLKRQLLVADFKTETGARISDKTPFSLVAIPMKYGFIWASKRVFLMKIVKQDECISLTLTLDTFRFHSRSAFPFHKLRLVSLSSAFKILEIAYNLRLPDTCTRVSDRFEHVERCRTKFKDHQLTDFPVLHICSQS